MQLFPSFCPAGSWYDERKGEFVQPLTPLPALSLMHVVISVHLWPLGDDLQ